MVLLFALIGLVPLISGWVGCYLLSREMAARGHLSDDVRISICFACVIWGSLVALVTEFCGVFRHLQESWILLSWTFISATLILVAFDFRRKRGASLRGSIRGRIRRVSEVLQTCPWDIKCLMAMTILWLVFLGLLGAMFPATTWDSMTYHLPRVIYWIDQHAVDHFPTENGRQLESGPWSGFKLAAILRDRKS